MKPPQIPKNIQWLNTDRSFSWEDLKGHVVILDFWTYCCINCLHVLPDLMWLEHKYTDKPVVVIGVHSAKFDNEKSVENITHAINRYEIEHPVIVDSDHDLWNQFAIRAWPSFVVVGTDGQIAHTASGEGMREDLDDAIAALLEMGEQKGTLAKNKITWSRPVHKSSTLSFPGKLATDEKNNRLFISDSNHNRILEVQLDAAESGRIVRTFEGFSKPQGLSYEATTDSLYVCDTENHVLRQIHLKTGDVKTLAEKTILNSPWDCVLSDGVLYIAMAGAHQIWKLDLATQKMEPFAGSGHETIIDGDSSTAAFAQPSGITVDGAGHLFVADSEVSAVRAVDTKNGKVITLCGTGLFDFGHTDGAFAEALFQHCLGICYWRGILFVADTYNHALRALDLQNRQVHTLIHREDNGLCQIGSQRCEEIALQEPSDVKVMGDMIYIADTNNHLIRFFDLQQKKLGTLTIKGGDDALN